MIFADVQTVHVQIYGYFSLITLANQIILFSCHSLTCASSQPHPSQEDVAGHSFFVPHSQLQADVVEVSRLQAAVGEGVVPLWVHGVSLRHGLVLG